MRCKAHFSQQWSPLWQQRSLLASLAPDVKSAIRTLARNGVRVNWHRHTERAALEAANMASRQEKRKRHQPKTILRFPDLEQWKNAVVNSLAAASSQESYGHAIDEFVGWYCSEPRLAFNRTVVLRYRFFLEQKNLAPSTINVRLAAVRRLAYGGHSSSGGWMR
jgi:hypothetical protein